MASKRFIIIGEQHIGGGIIKIIVDKNTGVNYIVSSGIGISGMTPLLDENGQVVITK